MRTIAGSTTLTRLSAAERARLISRTFFPSLIGPPFMDALRGVFLFALVISVVAAIASLLRGKRVYADEEVREAAPRARDHLLVIALVAAWKARAGARPDSSAEARRRLIRAMALLSLVLADGTSRSGRG